jgi:hypothetical protein
MSLNGLQRHRRICIVHCTKLTDLRQYELFSPTSYNLPVLIEKSVGWVREPEWNCIEKNIFAPAQYRSQTL